MGEPREDHESPVDSEASVPGADGQWLNVPRPTTEELLAPSAQVADPPRIPTLVKVVGLLVVVLLLAMSVVLGFSLGRSDPSESTPTPSVDESLWPLEAPTTVGSFVRGDVTSTPAKTSGDRDIVTANYTDGTDKMILSLSRPEDDLVSYLENAGVKDAEPIEGTKGISCGIFVISTDKSARVCARVVDDTAIAVAGLSDQDSDELTSLVDSFYSALQ